MLTNLLAVTALLGVAFPLGLEPAAGTADRLDVAGMVVLLSVAAGWMTVAMGLAAKTPETAGMASLPLVVLPFFSSAIAPAEAMGPGLRQFAASAGERAPPIRSTSAAFGTTCPASSARTVSSARNRAPGTSARAPSSRRTSNGPSKLICTRLMLPRAIEGRRVTAP